MSTDRAVGRPVGRSTGGCGFFFAHASGAYIAHSARVWGGARMRAGVQMSDRPTDRSGSVGRSVVRPSVRPSARVRRGCATSAVVVAARVHRRRRSPSSKVASTVVEVTRQTFVVDESASSTPFVVVVVVVVDTTRARTRLRVMSRYSRKTADGVRLARRRSFTVVVVVVSRVRRSPSTVVVTPRRRRSPSSSSAPMTDKVTPRQRPMGDGGPLRPAHAGVAHGAMIG